MRRFLSFYFIWSEVYLFLTQIEPDVFAYLRITFWSQNSFHPSIDKNWIKIYKQLFLHDANSN